MDDSLTCRPSSPDLEKYLQKPIKLLDHGFIRLIDYMGDDQAVTQAARVSYGKGTRKLNEDQGLIRYLMRHRHTSPFEMCELKLHIKLPIFVARQWLRHRMASVNEYSARYSVLDNEFYTPNPDQLSGQSTINHQSRDQSNHLEPKQAEYILDLMKRDANQCYDSYQDMLECDNHSEQGGLARELARINLPVSFYTQFYWKIDLHNLLHFIALRIDSHAQYEIRIYARALMEMVRAWLPLTAQAFDDYVLNSVKLSAQAITCLKKRLNGENISPETSGMSKGEWKDFTLFLEKIEESDQKTIASPHPAL